MKVCVASTLIALISTAMAVDPASITSMSPREQIGFRDVSASCERDVQQLCRGGEDAFLSMMPPPLPSLREMESFIDHVMVSSLHMPSESSSFLLILEDQQQPKAMIDCVDRAVQHLLDEIAGKTPVADVLDTAQRIAEHGSILLESETEDETHIRVARRLSEVTPEDLHERQQALMPYSTSQTACLRAAYGQGRLSLSCGRAIYRLDQIRDAQYRADFQFRQDRAVVMVNLLCLYALVIATGMMIYWRRRKDMRAKRRLTRQIFQAIYSQPHLKQAVEREMGRSAGHVPPLPAPALWRMGLLGNQLKGIFRTCRLLRLLFIMIVTICFVMAPLTTLPVVVGYAAAVFWCAAFSPKPVEICACCCCAATTQDAKNGTLSAEQACCGCCNGTGVCSVQCASCCGTSKKQGAQDGCCDGCCDDCCCSSEKKVGAGGCCDNCCCCSGTKMEAGGCCDNCCCCCSTMKKGGAKYFEGCCDDCCCCSAMKNGGAKSVEGCCDDCCCCSGTKMEAGGCCDDCCCFSTMKKEGVKSVEGCCDDCCCCSTMKNGGAKSVEGCCDDCCCCSNKKMEGGGCCDNCSCCTKKKEGVKTLEGCCDNCCCSGAKMEAGGCCDNCCCSAMKNEGAKLVVGSGCCCCSSGCCAGGTCCGGTGCGTCSCCTGTCCCSADQCCNTMNRQKKQKHPQVVVYEGVPVQIV